MRRSGHREAHRGTELAEMTPGHDARALHAAVGGSAAGGTAGSGEKCPAADRGRPVPCQSLGDAWHRPPRRPRRPRSAAWAPDVESAAIRGRPPRPGSAERRCPSARCVPCRGPATPPTPRARCRPPAPAAQHASQDPGPARSAPRPGGLDLLGGRGGGLGPSRAIAPVHDHGPGVLAPRCARGPLCRRIERREAQGGVPSAHAAKRGSSRLRGPESGTPGQAHWVAQFCGRGSGRPTAPAAAPGGGHPPLRGATRPPDRRGRLREGVAGRVAGARCRGQGGVMGRGVGAARHAGERSPGADPGRVLARGRAHEADTPSSQPPAATGGLRDPALACPGDGILPARVPLLARALHHDFPIVAADPRPHAWCGVRAGAPPCVRRGPSRSQGVLLQAWALPACRALSAARGHRDCSTRRRVPTSSWERTGNAGWQILASAEWPPRGRR